MMRPNTLLKALAEPSYSEPRQRQKLTLSLCLSALYGCYFPDNQEAAFSNYRLWESLGFVVAFAYGNYLCINVKLYILLAVLVLGMVGYFTAELVHYQTEKNSFTVGKPSNYEAELAQSNPVWEGEDHLNKMA